jgi:hypothetical protein
LIWVFWLKEITNYPDYLSNSLPGSALMILALDPFYPRSDKLWQAWGYAEAFPDACRESPNIGC